MSTPIYDKTDSNARKIAEDVIKEREFYIRRLQELMEMATLEKILIVYAFAQGVVK